MNAFACNTYSFINKEGERHWIRLHLVSDLPKAGFSAVQAKQVAGEDPDFLRKDLRKALEEGYYPKWRLCFQAMKESEGYEHAWTFDPTKFWPINDYPLNELGVIELNSYPQDHWAQTEQVAFSPANVVPGIGFSPDRLLQGRLFIYADTQFHRLGPNFRQIPINLPHNEFATPYYGGPHRQLNATFPSYYPSCFGGLKPHSELDANKIPFEKPLKCEDASFFPITDEGDITHFEQIRETWKNSGENHLSFNVARSLAKVSKKEIVDGVLALISKVDKEFRKEVDDWLEKCNKRSQEVVTEGQQLIEKMNASLHKDAFQVCD